MVSLNHLFYKSSKPINVSHVFSCKNHLVSHYRSQNIRLANCYHLCNQFILLVELYGQLFFSLVRKIVSNSKITFHYDFSYGNASLLPYSSPGEPYDLGDLGYINTQSLLTQETRLDQHAQKLISYLLLLFNLLFSLSFLLT